MARNVRADDCTDRGLIDLTTGLDHRRMRPNQDRFLRDIQGYARLSPKQRAWLEDILESHALLLPPRNVLTRRLRRGWQRIAPQSWVPLGVGAVGAALVLLFGTEVSLIAQHLELVSTSSALLGGLVSKRRWTSS